MSDEDTTTAVAAEKSIFTPKEEEVLKAAWHCLKSPPEVDMNKLMEHANFKTVKTASNTWGVIKKKLNINIEGGAAPKSSNGAESTTPKSTPKKAAVTPRKRAKKVAEPENDDHGEANIRSLKKVRKSPTKNSVKEEVADDESTIKAEAVNDDDEV